MRYPKKEIWKKSMHHRKREVWKGLAAGLVGGLAGSFAMNQFQNVWSKASEAMQSSNHPQSEDQPKQQKSEPDATMKAAEKISENIAHQQLSEEQQKKAGPWVHYAFGTAVGGAYGAATEFMPATKKGLGLPFGAAVFVGADEIGVPALGLAKSSAQVPLSQHAYGLVSHFVYGLTTELVRRGLRAAIA